MNLVADSLAKAVITSAKVSSAGQPDAVGSIRVRENYQTSKGSVKGKNGTIAVKSDTDGVIWLYPW